MGTAAAHEPAMMLGLLLYAYARGRRSSRQIERSWIEDVAYRVIAANRVPDHTTIARFRERHEDAIASLVGDMLGLHAGAGSCEVALTSPPHRAGRRQLLFGTHDNVHRAERALARVPMLPVDSHHAGPQER